MTHPATHRADWLREAQYGFFFHFLSPQETTPEAWNRQVDSFDVAAFADQMHRLRAGYVFLTVGQNSGFYCSPNAALDRFTGRSGATSRCSRRDLIADFSAALEPYGIALLVYTTTLAPARDHEASRLLRSVPPWNSNWNCGNYDELKRFAVADPRLRDFIRMWSEIHAEWAARWGRRIKGWWMDGCYFADRMFDFPDKPNGMTVCNALRSGNPDAIVALNPGVVSPPHAAYPAGEDYTAGETDDPLRGIHCGSRIDGLQYHILTFAGTNWGSGPLRFSGTEMAGITRTVSDNGGAVTWDLPFTPAGLAPEVFDELQRFTGLYHRSREAVPPLAVETTEIIRDETGGAHRNGRLIVTAGQPCEFRVSYDGDTVSSQGNARLEAALPPPVSGDRAVTVECNGFTRKFILELLRSFTLKESGNASFTLVRDDVELARYRMRIDGGTWLLEGKIFDPAPEIRADAPWQGSSLELFFATRRVHRQLVFLPDGRVFCCRSFGMTGECRNRIIRRDSDGFGFSVAIPAAVLQLEKGERSFRFELVQHIRHGNGFLSASLCDTVSPQLSPEMNGRIMLG